MVFLAIARRAYVAFLIAVFVALYLQGPAPPNEPCHFGFEHAHGSLSGQLLVATPAIDDGYFEGTRILLLAHDEDGALGVVLNKGEIAPAVWDGGPVGRDRVITLLDEHAAKDGAARVLDGVSVLTDPDLLDDDGVRAHARVFVGYAGWGPGQLEGELAMGAWRLERATAHDALDPPSSSSLGVRDPFETGAQRDPFFNP